MNEHLKTILSLMVEKGADINATNKYGESALHLTCTRLNLGVTHALLEKGANPNLKNKVGETCLHKIARAGNNGLTISQCLLEYGADINIVSLAGKAIDLVPDPNDNKEICLLLSS